MFICLKCKKKYKESDLTIETYGEDFDLERYCCPNCDGTCIELEDYHEPWTKIYREG